MLWSHFVFALIQLFGSVWKSKTQKALSVSPGKVQLKKIFAYKCLDKELT